MNAQKQRFEEYLKELKLHEPEHLMGKFEHYHQLLVQHNKIVNLVSRKMPFESYWTQHFLDSLLAIECLDFTDQVVLDFGSGGGLPGIPIRMVSPTCTMVLLDSVQKKMRALGEIITDLALGNTHVEAARVEDYAFMPRRPSFDIILCRAVALEDRYFPPLRRLLKPSGRLIMYKSRSMDDVAGIQYEQILEKDDPDLGYRRLISIAQRELMKR